MSFLFMCAFVSQLCWKPTASKNLKRNYKLGWVFECLWRTCLSVFAPKAFAIQGQLKQLQNSKKKKLLLSGKIDRKTETSNKKRHLSPCAVGWHDVTLSSFSTITWIFAVKLNWLVNNSKLGKQCAITEALRLICDGRLERSTSNIFFFRRAGEFCAQGSGLRYLLTDYIIPFAKWKKLDWYLRYHG